MMVILVLTTLHMTLRYSGALELQNSVLFGLFSSILSVPLSHKTFLLTGSSTSTLPPPHIHPTFFFPMSISLLNKWHLFSWPRHRKARYFSLTHSTDLYAALTLPAKNKAKQKISNTSSIPPTHTFTQIQTYTHKCPLLPPSMLYIMKLADVIHNHTLTLSSFYKVTLTVTHKQCDDETPNIINFN